jgi:hypothetical protein
MFTVLSVAGMTRHLIFHISGVSILTILYFNFFLASFCGTFLTDGIATSFRNFYVLFLLTIMSGLLVRTSLSVCTPSFHITVICSCSHTALGMCQYKFSVVSMFNFWHIELRRCVQTLSCLMMYSFFTKMLSLGVKQPEREPDHSLHLVPRSEIEWSCTCIPPIQLHGVVLS